MNFFSARISLLGSGWRFHRLSVAWMLCLVAGCSGLLSDHKRRAVDAPGSVPITTDAPKVQFLGNVHVIGNGGRFVLVQSPAAILMAGLVDGQDLVCRSDGNITATLRVSHERRTPFLVADVATGTPGLGDEVFIEAAGTRTPPVQTPPPAPEFRANPPLPSVR